LRRETSGEVCGRSGCVRRTSRCRMRQMKDYGESSNDETHRLTLKELPPDERPRERLLAKGAGALTDAELLAIIIRDGTRKESALDIGRRLLKMFGTLRNLRERSAAELCLVKGIGPARAAQILAALNLASRMGEKKLEKGSGFTGSEAVFKHFHPQLRFLKQERFLCLLLDTKNRVMKEVVISTGGLNAALMNPRDVLRAAVAEAASAIILIHNHPSGDPKPSADDRHVTRRIKEACDLTGIRMLDHIIIGEEGYRSLADEGEL